MRVSQIGTRRSATRAHVTMEHAATMLGTAQDLPVPRADQGCLASGPRDDVVSSRLQVSGGVATGERCAGAGTPPATRLDDTRDGDVTAKAKDKDSELDSACYVCFDASGPMLVNVCACRSTRVHGRCLMELVRHQQS